MSHANALQFEPFALHQPLPLAFFGYRYRPQTASGFANYDYLTEQARMSRGLTKEKRMCHNLHMKDSLKDNPDLFRWLGKEKDSNLAKEFNVSRERIRQIRARYGIPRPDWKEKRYCGHEGCYVRISNNAKWCKRHKNIIDRVGATKRSYDAWRNMIKRCCNPEHPQYHHYGGRGITVCEEWKNSFESFYNYMGDPPKNLTLERLDNDGNYEPENCVWVSNKCQNNNRRPKNDGTPQKPRRIKQALCQYYFHGQGWDIYRIAKHLRMSPMTVKKYKDIIW